ncbi:MAG: ABC transporter ATP-binding protein [Actinomycetaceae bacterium]|nr:ABC transporter ATP-binding protein [Actinomycetaceae bacterium]
MTIVATVSDVSLWRGKTDILTSVNWQVEEGQHWVVIGPNGAGKTTLIDLLAGRLYPSRGTVEILGETLGRTEIAEIRQRVGYTSPALSAQIPSDERVLRAVLTASYGMTATWRETYEAKDFSRAKSLTQMFEVDHLEERRFGTLSQGEKHRVMVARALMIDPEMLILDEPASALDLGGRELLLQGLAELAAVPSSPVMVMVTHHLEQIPRGFTHAMIMKDGKIFAAGEIAQVLTSENLSEVFGLPLQVGSADGRWWARSPHMS